MYLYDVIQKFGGNLICGDNTKLDNFTINSNDKTNDSIFIGIKGNSDGSIYYLDALKNGCKGVIINKGFYKEKYKDKFILEVDDTISYIKKLASYKRSKLNIPVIGITGSVGKTSTKDIISQVLEEKYRVCKTKGNLNNHIGLPLTILSYKDEDILVAEMGMNHLGEISELSKILRPNIGIITNITTAHIGNLGSRENILKAKLEILDGLDKNGKLIINNDNDLLHKWYIDNKNDNIITIGINNNSEYMAYDISFNNNTKFKYNNIEFNMNIGAKSFIYNSLFSIVIGTIFGIDYDKLKHALSNIKLTSNRLEIIKNNNYTIISDCYNANYDSMIEAINNLNMYNNRKIAILGDMLELGSYSREIHEKIGEYLNKTNINILIVMGKYSKYIYNKFNGEKYIFNNIDDIINFTKKIIKDNDVILIKASNKMNFIKIVNELKK